MTRQIGSLQTQLEVANMKISQLQSDNKSYMEKLDTAEEDISKLKKHVGYYRSLLEQEKMKIANMTQKALETGDLDLISFIEDLISGK